jgi:nicotinamidase-related amidase
MRAVTARAAIVVIDVLNSYEHADAEPLISSARLATPEIERLIGAARERGVPVIWANDNHGQWSACAPDLVERALAGSAPELVRPLVPPDDAPFVVKARHSAFFATQLELLLRAGQIERVALCGQVTEQCVLYTALDAHIREFEVLVAGPAVAHVDERLARAALEMMERNLGSRLCGSVEELVRELS